MATGLAEKKFCDCDNGGSLSLTTPFVWRWVRSTPTTSHLFSSTFTGCVWPKVYTTSSVYLYTAAYTDQHHAAFNRQSVRWRAWNHGVVCGQSHHPTWWSLLDEGQGDRAFVVAGPRARNNLPDAIRHSPSLETFKRSLKSHLFLQCFLLSFTFLVFAWQLYSALEVTALFTALNKLTILHYITKKRQHPIRWRD